VEFENACSMLLEEGFDVSESAIPAGIEKAPDFERNPVLLWFGAGTVYQTWKHL